MLSAHKEPGRASQRIHLKGASENEKREKTSEAERNPGAKARRLWRKSMPRAFQWGWLAWRPWEAQGEEELVKQARKGCEGLCIVGVLSCRQWGDAGIVLRRGKRLLRACCRKWTGQVGGGWGTGEDPEATVRVRRAGGQRAERCGHQTGQSWQQTDRGKKGGEWRS